MSRCCDGGKCASAELPVENPEMLTICCDARVCGGRAWEPFVYRCMACGRHLSLRAHHAGKTQIYWNRG